VWTIAITWRPSVNFFKIFSSETTGPI
jgi:hypothetical protein